MHAGLNQIDDLLKESIELLNLGDLPLAEIFARRSLAADPLNIGALSTLGLALHRQGKYPESEQIYLQMASMEPAEPMHWMNVGTARRCDKRIDDALYAFAKAAALGADTADFYYNVALAHIAREDYESGRSLLLKAFALSPGDAEIRYRYALCCYETLRTDEALTALEGWESLSDAAPELSANAGHLLMVLGDISRAEPIVRAAALHEDADPHAQLMLVHLLERTNRISEARATLDRLKTFPTVGLLGNDIKMTEAQVSQRESRHEVAARLFKELGDACKDLHLRHYQLYPLAKSLDALGRYDEAYGALTAAHLSQHAFLVRNSPHTAAYGVPPLLIADLSCEERDIAAWDQHAGPSAEASPIFIVGFPRSGTTLLELVLDAHPGLQSMDEQPFLQNALDDIRAENVHYPDQLAKLNQQQLDRIRKAYWSRAARRLQLNPRKRLIDKNPLNILRLPVIKRLFPNAKILLAIRHPCDVILSCFMQHFRAPDFALLCKDIPTLTGAYLKTFNFWYAQKILLQADIFELRYETFVDNFDDCTRRVFDFLEVPWDESVLSPSKRAEEKRFISTPSYAQVVQPVNRRSVNRWINYRSYLEASLPHLEPYLRRWGYGG